MMPLNMPVSASRSSSTSEPEHAQLSRRAGPGEIRRVRLLGITGLTVGSRA